MQLIIQYWKYLLILVLISFIGFQKIQLAEHKSVEAHLQATIDTMVPIIDSNNKIIEQLNKDGEELITNLNESKIANQQLKFQLNKRIKEVISIDLPNDCSKSLKIMSAEIQKEIEPWNAGK